MTTNARIYVTVFVLLGVYVLTMAFAGWQTGNGARFISFFVLAIVASLLKVRMPAMAGKMPFNFLFVLVGLFELSLPEVLVVGCAAAGIESVWRQDRRQSLLDVYFGVANMAVAIAVAYRMAGALSSRESVPDWVSVGAGTIIFFAFNTFPAASVSALSSGNRVIRTWIEESSGATPFYLAGGVIAWAFHRAAGVAGWPTALLMIPALYLLYRTYRLYVARVEDERIHAEQLANLHMRTIEALALAIEAKDDTTGEHLKRVQVYAVEIGRQLGMTEHELEALRGAAILHDIGKLAVPEYIISKPGRLTPEEFEKMKVHPVVGAEILEHVQFPYPVVPIVRAHHEKWNGTGYPYGLSGENIPLGARVLSAVDALDALATDRQYRRALPLDEAMRKIEEESGKSFDPAVVEQLKRHYKELEAKAQRAKTTALKLSTGMRFGAGAEPAAGFEETRPTPFFDHRPEVRNLTQAIAQMRCDVQSLFESGISTADLTVDEICAVFALRLKRVLEYDAIAIYLLREDRIVPVHVQGHDHRLFSSLQIPMGQGLSGWVAENRKSIVNGNPSVEAGYLNNPHIFSTVRSALAVPLEGAAGVLGVISLYRDARDAFSAEHLRLVESLAPRFGRALESVLHREQTRLAPKVGGRLLDGAALLGRLEEELARCQRLNSPLGLIVCSIEGMARLSGPERDRLAARLLSVIESDCREFDVIGRTSEEEFILLVPNLQARGVRAKAMRIVQALPEMRISIGQAMFPQDGSHAEQLLAAADRRLFETSASSASEDDRAARRASSAWLQ